ncbi:MAG: hypothetical protein HRT47_06045 [Candidatus Caenarcaniphilales bacterium]|nr:hypothetical protein [Candidatus Caenarcaniphilales bacterium]
MAKAHSIISLESIKLSKANLLDTSKEKSSKSEYIPRGYIDINAYYPALESDIFTLNNFLDLPYGFEYFSFINFNFPDYYTEQDLYWKIPKAPLDIATQYVSQSGNENEAFRFGTRLRISETSLLKKLCEKINLIYHVTVFPGNVDNFDGYTLLVEHFYRIQLLEKWLGDRLYLSGFLDNNLFIDSSFSDSSVTVTEHQIGFRLVNQLYAIAEVRYNGFLPDKNVGLGVGLEYNIEFGKTN